MDDKQAMHAMSIDDAYHVERTLARGTPRRLALMVSPRPSNMALPKPTRVPTYSRWAGYSDSC